MEIRNSNQITPDLIAAYCYEFSSSANAVLERLKLKSESTGQIQMLSGELSGRILAMFSKLIQPDRILEIGTFTGYGTICLCEGLTEHGRIFTIEKNPELEGFSNASLEELGIKDKVVQIIGDAAEIIPTLDEQFDLVFIDAAKRQYINYFELVLPMLRKGGVILADNTLWKGAVIQEEADRLGEGIKAFNKHVAGDERVHNVLLPVDDGINLIIKN